MSAWLQTRILADVVLLTSCGLQKRTSASLDQQVLSARLPDLVLEERGWKPFPGGWVCSGQGLLFKEAPLLHKGPGPFPKSTHGIADVFICQEQLSSSSAAGAVTATHPCPAPASLSPPLGAPQRGDGSIHGPKTRSRWLFQPGGR